MQVKFIWYDDKKLCRRTYYQNENDICYVENYNLDGFLDEIIMYDVCTQQINFRLKFNEKGFLICKHVYFYLRNKVDFIHTEEYDFKKD